MDRAGDNGTVAPLQEPQEPEPPSRSGLLLDLIVEVDCWGGPGQWGEAGDLEASIERTGVALDRELREQGLLSGPAEACIAFDDDPSVRELNARYRGKDKPTNVLSFPAGPQPGPQPEVRQLGDVILAYTTTRDEAREGGIAMADHVQHLIVHGVLHLLGFDHETDEEAERMETLERRILASLGISDPYSEATRDRE